MDASLRTFKNLPRISLSNLDTPIEACNEIAGRNHARLFIKRDDFIGSLVWGNKLRKLEYTLAEALAEGAHTIITCGAVQSNHARITAQVCKRLGLDCVLVQNGEKPAVPSGNHKINLMLGVPVHYVDSREERSTKMTELYEELKANGHKPYVIPLGASNAAGCPGFVNALIEVNQQQKQMGLQFDYIFHATSSGGTQAGLEVGKRLLGLDALKIIGISADNSIEDIGNSVLECALPLLERINAPFKMQMEELHTDVSFTGPGYGIPSEASTEAARLFAEKEGVLLDKTYTAKAAAGLLHYLFSGKIPKNKNVLFWHTGGLISEL